MGTLGGSTCPTRRLGRLSIIKFRYKATVAYLIIRNLFAPFIYIRCAVIFGVGAVCKLIIRCHIPTVQIHRLGRRVLFGRYNSLSIISRSVTIGFLSIASGILSVVAFCIVGGCCAAWRLGCLFYNKLRYLDGVSL